MIPQEEWEWPIVPSQQQHSERVALLRPIPYELTAPLAQEPPLGRQGHALSLNISSGGMLVLMDLVPPVEWVLKIRVPTPLALVETPTLAEVRWVRKIPFGGQNGLSLVGLKFLF